MHQSTVSILTLWLYAVKAIH